MSYEVIAIPRFRRDIKPLAKKYPSLKTEYAALVKSLRQNPRQGTDLGNHCYKIRLGIASKGKGKSGGARVVTCIRILQHTVYLLTIFDKSDKENISNKELRELLKWIP
jgi:hypothetical protein